MDDREQYQRAKEMTEVLRDSPGVVPHYESSIRLPETGIEVDVEARFDDRLNETAQYVNYDFDTDVSEALNNMDDPALGEYVREQLGEEAAEEGLNPLWYDHHDVTELDLTIYTEDRAAVINVAERLLITVDDYMAENVREYQSGHQA